jgi:thiol-disulfide isomerase/thioredoxin
MRKSQITLAVIAAFIFVLLVVTSGNAEGVSAQTTPNPFGMSTSTPVPFDGSCEINSTEVCTTPEGEGTPVPILDQAPFAEPANPQEAVIVVFWGEGCTNCEREFEYLNQLEGFYSTLQIVRYEVLSDPEGRELFYEVAETYGFEPQNVPTTLIGNRYWIGFNPDSQSEMLDTLELCLQNGCPDPVANPGVVGTIESGSTTDVITLPFFGTINLEHQSLFLSTLLISFVDGFNPCSLWVLSILLGITLHTGSRKKILFIGSIFITVTAGVYALFIAGLFTVFTFVNFIGWIQIIVALLALFFAGVNIKDYFWYKEGVSFTIDDSKKPGIYKSIRRVMEAGDSMWGLAGATVIMSAGVSLVEFSCTAGFPVLWSTLIAEQNVPVLTFVLLLLLYLFIYQIDEIGIFLAAVFTLKANKMEEKEGRVLKLIGGMLMLTLAVVMLVSPEIMNRVSTSLLVFGIAFAASMLVLLVHRVILPRFGVWIGSEKQNRKK